MTVSLAAATGPARAADLSDALTLTGRYRVRYEALDGRVQPGQAGSDQILVQKALLGAQFDAGPVYLGAELLDARAWLDDTGTPLGTDDVNTVELLRGYVGTRGRGLLSKGDRYDIILGRITMDVGSRRFVARNRFRNTINGFTGLRGQWTGPGGDRVQAFFTLPVARRPGDVASLLDNEADIDQELPRTRFWGVHVARPELLPGLSFEAFAFWLDENDGDRTASLDRSLFTPGVRFVAKPAPGRFDGEVEAAFQVGESSRSRDADAPHLEHRAGFVHAEIGYTFEDRLNTRLSLQYDFASGDTDPSDNQNNRFDTLFGARRFDFGPTGIYGIFARTNINTPGIRLSAAPSSRWTGFARYRPVFLAAARDALPTFGVTDPSGASGRFLGHQTEFRIRHNIIPGAVRLETGAAWLAQGRFLREAPNAARDGDTFYAYAQTTFAF
ncbi:MAG: alginate export family protein [Alphaproteobacteria bacterium]